MHTIHMVGIIGFIANDMLPEPSLPYSSFSFGNSDLRAPFGVRQFLHKPDLDAFPWIGEIIIVRWQRPDRMQVIR